MVARRAGRRLAPSWGARQWDCRAERPPHRPGQLERRRHLLRLGRPEAAHRSGVGIRRAGWRAGRQIPVGNELLGQDGALACNIWQGRFPTENSRDDGYLTTAPVRTYQPNGYGLWQMVGNVWEWCQDWFGNNWYERSPSRDPRGPEIGSARVLRGGSFLCHNSYCNRYRNSARSSNTPDSAASNIGFRTVAL